MVVELGGDFGDEGEELEGCEVVHRVSWMTGLVGSPGLEHVRGFELVWVELAELI
jgi:hypothetical protein